MAGSGAHLHVSLLDSQGRNVFAAEDAARQRDAASRDRRARRDDGRRRWLIFAPTANSYRRFRPEAYVPLNPSWAVNNRGVALRVPHSPPANRRVEHRVAGADANPYLLAAAVLAGMHHGLTQRLDPGPPLAGNAYRDATRDDSAHLAGRRSPRSSAATSCATTSAMRSRDLYAATRRGEMQEFNSHVLAARLRLVPDDELSGHA